MLGKARRRLIDRRGVLLFDALTCRLLVSEPGFERLAIRGLAFPSNASNSAWRRLASSAAACRSDAACCSARVSAAAVSDSSFRRASVAVAASARWESASVLKAANRASAAANSALTLLDLKTRRLGILLELCLASLVVLGPGLSIAGSLLLRLCECQRRLGQLRAASGPHSRPIPPAWFRAHSPRQPHRLAVVGALFSGLERRASGRYRRRVLFLELTTGIVSGRQSSLEVLTRCLERLDGVSVCEVAFSALGSEFLASNHFLRERGVEHRLLLGNAVRRLPVDRWLPAVPPL